MSDFLFSLIISRKFWLSFSVSKIHPICIPYGKSFHHHHLLTPPPPPPRHPLSPYQHGSTFPGEVWLGSAVIPIIRITLLYYDFANDSPNFGGLKREKSAYRCHFTSATSLLDSSLSLSLACRRGMTQPLPQWGSGSNASLSLSLSLSLSPSLSTLPILLLSLNSHCSR